MYIKVNVIFFPMPNHRAMEAYTKRGGKVPPILNIGTIWGVSDKRQFFAKEHKF
jgi:hypothetical protein